MASLKTSTLKKVFFIAGLLYAAVYLTACLTPYIHPADFWPMSFLALGFAYLAGGMILLFVLSLFIYRKISWIFFLILLSGYQNISSTFSFHARKEFNDEKQANTFRLLSWNVNYFGNCQIKNDGPNSIRRQMFAFIQQKNPDVLCIQDFSNFIKHGFYSDYNYVKDSLHYPYTYFPVDYAYHADTAPEQYGPVIFSRYPISDTGRVRFFNEPEAESFQFATIDFKGTKIKLFNAHFKSMRIHAQSASPREYNFLEADTGLLLHASTFKKLKHFDKIHIQQAELVKTEMNKTDLPIIFCGDINSVPASFVYQLLRKNLDDAFLSTGFGFGGTYDSISPTLRIDVVLPDKRLKVMQHQTPHLHLSDHYPNLVDIRLR
jgi:endonuclease/exonuclease/phosphatase family metal-dependent hydrolase